MREYQYYLFDWDGCIAKTLDIWHEAMKVALKNHGYSLNDKEIGANFSELAQHMKAIGYTDSDVVIAEAAELAAIRIPRVELYSGAVETLVVLKAQGKRIGLVTTSVHEIVDPQLKAHEISHLFDTVVCGDDVTWPKPNPEPIMLALRLLSADPRQSVMIGDSDADVLSANSAAIESIVFHPPEYDIFSDLEQLRHLGPTAIITNFSQLIES